MPVYQDQKTKSYYAVCEHCGKQSTLIPETLRITIMLLAEKYGWCLTEDGEITFCSEEHLDANDIENLEKLLGENEPGSS